MAYGEPFRRHRRMFHQYFNKEAVTNYNSVQLCETRLLIQNLLTDPSDCDNLFNRSAAYLDTGSLRRIIMHITYGHQIASHDDPYMKLVDELGSALTQAGPVGASILDFFPFLQYMPSWFPGTYYVQFARDNAPKVCDMHELLFKEV
ncbi:hypothetical protein FPV67DRAFT_1430925 [Lyophyllum atratum]|nr:hypothetical protein FPV67DRAFT_1430925 [Lyophyllum atratum]